MTPMSVPLFDVRSLWEMAPDAFNEWRAEHDLPILYEYFLERLPAFKEWVAEFNIDRPVFCRVVPTGEIFAGNQALTLVRHEVDRTSFHSYHPFAIAKDEFARRSALNQRPVPEMKEVVPYLLWGAKRFNTSAFIPSDNQRVDTFQYNSWSSVGYPPGSRASLFRTFEVLKLGGLTLPPGIDVSGRNFDFADLDYLTIEGEWHGSRQTSAYYSSCRNITIHDAELAFFRFYQCWMDDFTCISARLYSFSFANCQLGDLRFEDTRLHKVTFERSGARFYFDRCELVDFAYVPAEAWEPSSVAETYRQIRTAYQNSGQRHNAAETYYKERLYERKALFDPYVTHSELFPPTQHHGTLKQIVSQWRRKEVSLREGVRRSRTVLKFHLKVWLHPKYAVRAARFKLPYAMSLVEAATWGYGERPGRIILTALSFLTVFTGLYYRLLNSASSPPTSLLDCVYLSIVTFTTLGYGDITPKTPVMKMACGTEALLERSSWDLL